MFTKTMLQLSENILENYSFIAGSTKMVSMESFSHTGDQKRKKNFMVKTLKLFRSHLQKEFLCAGEIMKLMRRSFY